MNDSSCFHCGDLCIPPVIEYDEKQFCCHGCKTVYGIIAENNLTDFYEIERNSGISQRNNTELNTDFLMDEQFTKRYITYQDDEKVNATLHIPEIHCNSCIWLLEKLPELSEDIFSSRVNFLTKELDLIFSTKSDLKQVVDLLINLGYTPTFTLDNKKHDDSYMKSLIIRLGVAGFCFGNIMLLSFPEYISTEITSDFNYLFKRLSILLSIPVLFYGSDVYLKSAYHAIKNKGLNLDVPISIGIASLYCYSLYQILVINGVGYLDSFTGLVFFLLIGRIFQHKTYSHLSFVRDYTSYFPISVTKINGETEQSIPFDDIEIGDEILIRNGEIIPSDAILMSDGASLDFSFVTGESNKVSKQKHDKLYAGGKNVGSSFLISITESPSKSYFIKLWNNFDKKVKHSFLDEKVEVLSKYFTIIVLATAFITLVCWWTISPAIAIKSFVSVLIVACPCALALSIPFTFGNTIRLMGNVHFYLKNINVIESLNKVSHIVFDKTGTLTDINQMEVRYEGISLTESEEKIIATVCYQSSHPLSVQISTILNKSSQTEISDFQDFKGKGLIAQTTIGEVKIGSADFVGLTNYESSSTEVHISIGGKYKGKFLFRHEYRSNIQNMMKSLETYNLSLLSGDQSTEKQFLQKLIGDDIDMHFNKLPHQKKEFIEAEESQGHTMMIGDGLNDAIALNESTVGVAVTNDLNQFTPASDIIVKGKSLHKLPQILKLARASINITYVCFGISFLYNIVGLSFAVMGNLSPLFSAILMPLSSISVVLFSILATNLVALRLK